MKIKKYDEHLGFSVKSETLSNGMKIQNRGIDIVKAIKEGYDPSVNIPVVGGNKDYGVSRGTNIAYEQMTELKRRLQEIEKELAKLNIDTTTDNGRIEALAYFYKIMQRDIKYFSPLVRLGNWESRITDYPRIGVISPDTPYGALIEKYALCEGISKGLELLCNYFNMDCDTISVRNCGVGHCINRLRLDNEQVTYIDLSAEIGMNQDGRYVNANTQRVVPIEKVNTTTDYFLVNSQWLESKGYRSDEFSKCKSTFMLSKHKDELMQKLQRKMSFRPKITINSQYRNDINR